MLKIEAVKRWGGKAGQAAFGSGEERANTFGSHSLTPAAFPSSRDIDFSLFFYISLLACSHHSYSPATSYSSSISHLARLPVFLTRPLHDERRSSSRWSRRFQRSLNGSVHTTPSCTSAPANHALQQIPSRCSRPITIPMLPSKLPRHQHKFAPL